MLDKNQVNKIKETTEEFFKKMTPAVLGVEVVLSSVDGPPGTEDKEVVNLNIKLDEPQTLIGQGGQTLFEIQRLLKMILNKKLQSIFYLNLDINDYKKKKTEYLKNFVKDLANEVFFTKQEKALSPMPAYERRIIHSELSGRTDVITESRGEGLERHIVIKLKETDFRG